MTHRICKRCQQPFTPSSQRKDRSLLCDEHFAAYMREASLRSYYRHQQDRLVKRRNNPNRTPAYMRQKDKESHERHRTHRLIRLKQKDHARRSAIGQYTMEQWEGRLNFYGRRCYLCGCDWDALTPSHRTIDHVIPLSKGGTNWPANLRPACRPCNSGKRDR